MQDSWRGGGEEVEKRKKRWRWKEDGEGGVGGKKENEDVVRREC